MERKWIPTTSEIIDRLSIVTLKSIILGCNNPEKKKAYEEEASLIMSDLTEIMKKESKKIKDWGVFIRAIQLDMLANRLVWENETLARAGGRSQDHLLPFTHSVNSIRMRAGNFISAQLQERKDLNLDRCVDMICKERGFDFSQVP
jgi:hypothetical protein